MASQPDNSVSQELGELLELLNALETQDSRPLENFATLERLLAAGKAGPAESSSEDHPFDDHPFEDHQSAEHHAGGWQTGDYQPELEVDGATSDAQEPPSGDELIFQRAGRDEAEMPAHEGSEAEIENRLAVHIIQGLRKSMKDWTS